jgi:hypothetical protein
VQAFFRCTANQVSRLERGTKGHFTFEEALFDITSTLRDILFCFYTTIRLIIS